MSRKNYIIFLFFLGLFIKFTFTLDILEISSILLFAYLLLVLINQIGKLVPVRTIASILFCLQFLIGPVLAYNFSDNYVYETYIMRIDKSIYFSYALPCAICFILGLNFKANTNQGERVDKEKLFTNTTKINSILYPLCFFGIFCDFFKNDVPSTFAFVFYLLGSLQYVAVFV